VLVVDAKGKQMDDGKATVSDNEPKLIQLGLTPSPSGKYMVVWRIVALDGHKARGKFSFTVK